MFVETPNPPPLKIVIYRGSSIGDVVLASSCLTLLQNIGLPHQVVWLGKQPSLSLIASGFPRVEAIELPQPDQVGGLESLVANLGSVHIVLDLQKTLRSRYICGQIARKNDIQVFTWSKESLRRSRAILSARVRGRTKSMPGYIGRTPKHQFEMMADGLRQALRKHVPLDRLDGLDGAAPPQLPLVGIAEETPWHKEMKFGNWLAVAPGAAHETKRAPLIVFERILRDLQPSCKDSLGLVFLGDESDRAQTLSLIDNIAWPSATLNLAGKLSLWESAVALSESNALLSNDSSLAHIAEAVGTSVGVLFGPTVEAFGFTPWKPTSRAFSANLGCRPCSKHGKSPCRYRDQKCFTDIDTKQVAEYLGSICEA